ncbi:MAG: endolytic transglycosylase MltG [Candidatus Saccharimonas sp.]
MDGFKRPSSRRPSRSQSTQQSADVAADEPPKAPSSTETPQPEQTTESVEPVVELTPPEVAEVSAGRVLKPKKSRLSKALVWAGVVVGVLVAIGGVAFTWYFVMTLAPNPSDDQIVRFEVKESSSLNTIASQLEQRGLVKNAFAFMLYARLHGQQNALQAGTCNLSPAETVREVLDKLTAGCHDFKSVTFYPGGTLETSLYAKTKATESNSEFADFSIRNSLVEAGYTDAEISEALSANYDSPLFADKPAGASYEGYVFGETYYVDIGATAKEVLQTAFDHMYEVVKNNDLEAKYKAQGLTLYQGITMASVVERELACEGKPTAERRDRCYGYQQTIAQVFLKRYKEGGQLGSDVTFIYASDKLGVPVQLNIDSPYNTRRYAGLPPGPIASPGELALKAVANPTNTDYYYFIAGDDGLIYFAKTLGEHEANIKNHCAVLCAEF